MNNTIWWILLILCLLFAVYAAFVIKNEKVEALSTGKKLLFHGFEFNLPRWWTMTLEEDNKLTFERTDTRYDWKATFNWIENPSGDLQDTFEKMAIKRELIFDEDTSIIQAPSTLVEIHAQGVEALRIEGTATQSQEHRVYYDAFIIQGEKGHLYLESRSSILNGLLEGPFFEQTVSKIKKAH
jgi:hypothetical protein